MCDESFQVVPSQNRDINKIRFLISLTSLSSLFIKSIYSQLFLKTDTFIRRTPGAGAGRFFIIIIIISSSSFSLSHFTLTKLSIRPTTDTLKSLTDTCEVLNVTANYDLEKKNSST